MTCLPTVFSLSVQGEEILSKALLFARVDPDLAEFELNDAPTKKSRVLTVSLVKAESAPSYQGVVVGLEWPSLVRPEGYVPPGSVFE